ncbi:hypothetical protein P4V86_03680 [Brevibacillus laterosporus]|uniref:hypothetical protein n=1 Tax=Brevibacillus laterosporus TaxID=1465 RepID=UPI000378EDBC|nr:hypothetical protein [Brevibacillus laterosporus]ATO48617.1 hypothetical protein BrL25_05490 [Brevibacillus laterosporus DSM 25]MED2002459.1 hypothetical protein [Brevibacillus laterosporus]
MDKAAYDKVVIEGQFADALCKKYDMMNYATSSVFALFGVLSNFRYPLLRGILNLDYGGKDDMEIIFHLEDDQSGNGHFKMNKPVEDLILEWKTSGTEITLLTTPRNPGDRDKLTDIARYFSNLFKAVMQRMTDNTVKVKKQESKVPKIKKGKVKGKKSKNRTVYIRQTTYRVVTPPPSPTEEREKRDYERHTHRWTRKGHHRRLRNGEVRWFPEKEIILDPDAVKEAKTYKIQKGKGE